jgi:uncharacterized protein
MEILFILLTILGLTVFEIITSIDNAIINAEVLSTMSQKARRWFLFWGILFAVFVVRGVLPFIIVWAALPGMGLLEVLQTTLASGDEVRHTIEDSAQVLLLGGGVFLVFVFFHWLFLEQKNFGLARTEKFFFEQGAWFFAVVSIMLMVIVWFALQMSSMLAFGAVVGSTAFFIIHGFRQFAEQQEKKLLSVGVSDFSKIAYLEVLDATFSVDGVIGAFAFTFSVPLILLGNGLGAVVLRQITVSNIERIKRYKYLKNGAMYSIFVLGAIMILDGFGYHIPAWFSPLAMFLTVGYFFNKSGANFGNLLASLRRKK